MDESNVKSNETPPYLFETRHLTIFFNIFQGNGTCKLKRYFKTIEIGIFLSSTISIIHL